MTRVEIIAKAAARRKEMWVAWVGGMTITAIGRRWGISTARAGQLLSIEQERRQDGEA